MIQLPDGTVAELIGAARGKAFFRWHDPTALDPVRLGWAQVGDVRHYPLPAARLLGSLKRGVKEKPSEKKRRALRLNALKRHHPTRNRGSKPGRAHTRIPS